MSAGTTYYVRVRAVNSSGLESANSSVLTQSTVPVVPNAPTISSVTAATFTATWNSVTGASEYDIDVSRRDDFADPDDFVTRNVSGTSVSVIGLTAGTTYYVRVRALNRLTANTVISENSPTISVKTSIPTTFFEFRPEQPACLYLPIFSYTNDTNQTIQFTINGSVDDDLVINGQIYEQYQYPYYNGVCGFPGFSNGSHTITQFVTGLAPGDTIDLSGLNYGGNIGWNLTVATGSI